MIKLDNGHLRFGFDESNGLMTEFVDFDNDVTHIAPPDPPVELWRAVFRAGTDEQSLVPPGAETQFTGSVTESSDGSKRAILRWNGILLQNHDAAVDVKVTVDLRADEPMSEWRIEVENRTQHYGLWSIDFPRFQKWPRPGVYDLLYGAYNWGRCIRKIDEKHSGRFSSYHWSMQFILLSLDDRAGIYVAAHDPDQFYKEFVCDPNDRTAMVLPVPNAGVSGNGYVSQYPIAVGTYRGGWLEGSKLYRDWAIGKTWTARGPISQRADVPKHIRDIGIWFIASYPENGSDVTPEKWAGEIIEAAKYYDVPCGVHVYGWHEIAFDNDYPEYFPAKRGVAEAFKLLTDAGIVTMPYINARLWDMRAKTYPEAVPYTVKDPQGVPYLEIYGRKSGLLVPMCPYTEFWQDRVTEICKNIVHELGANAIYLDQIAAESAKLCFDESHGHTLGGGTHWHSGYRQMLDKLRAMIADSGHEVALTTENPGDAHIDGCDAFLIWNPRRDDEVPMMTAVYSGYTLYFSSPHSTSHGLQSFVAAQGRDFIWGSQLGWMSPSMPDPYRSYLKRLGRFRVQMRDFLTYGELLGELKRTESVPKVSVVWPLWGDDKLTRVPAVMSMIWRAEDGRIGLFLVNVTEQKRTFTYSFDTADYGLICDSVRVIPVSEDGPQKAESVLLRNSFNQSVILEPYGVGVFEIVKA